MKRLRDPNWILIFIFVGILTAVPLIQLVVEAKNDEGIIAFEIFSEWPTASNLRAYEKKMESASWFGRVSRPWIQFAQFKWLKYGGEKLVFGSKGWFFFKPGLNYMLAKPDLAHRTTSTNDPVAAIVDFRDQLAARGVHLLLMPIPNKDSVYPDRLTARAEGLKSAVTPRTQKLLENLRAADVEVLDCFDLFSKARANNSGETSLYLAQDTHWSPTGVDLIAKAAAHRLLDLGWVHTGDTLYTERPAPVQRTGDILHMLQTPAIDRSVAPENVAATQIVTDGQQLYKDSPDGEVVIMGDSFMRIYQTDAPTAAGFIAHLAKELKQPMLSLVNDGGGATLVREELCNRPAFLKNKKVVLWEFVERDIGLAIRGWPKTTFRPETSTELPAAQTDNRSRTRRSGSR